MNKDQAYGWLILMGSVAIILIYLWAIFFSSFDLLTLKLTGTAAIVFGFGIMAWIGYTLATTPPPEPIEIPEEEVRPEPSEKPQETEQAHEK